MKYYFTEKEIVAFSREVIITMPNPNANGVKDFCLDENAYNLFKAMNTENYKLDGTSLVVGKKTTLRLLNAKPPKVVEDFKNSCEINLDNLAKAFKFVAHNDSSRPALNGVYVNSDGTIIATDSYKVYCDNKGESEDYVVLSQDLVSELIKYKGSWVLEYNDTIAQVIINDIKITGRLYQGEYPNIFALLKSPRNYLTLDSETLEKAVELGSFIKGDSVVLLFKNRELIVKDYGADSDVYCDELANIDESVHFVLKFDYFKMGFKALNSKVDFGYTDYNKPIFLTNENETICLMVMREA